MSIGHFFITILVCMPWEHISQLSPVTVPLLALQGVWNGFLIDERRKQRCFEICVPNDEKIISEDQTEVKCGLHMQSRCWILSMNFCSADLLLRQSAACWCRCQNPCCRRRIVCVSFHNIQLQTCLCRLHLLKGPVLPLSRNTALFSH